MCGVNTAAGSRLLLTDYCCAAGNFASKVYDQLSTIGSLVCDPDSRPQQINPNESRVSAYIGTLQYCCTGKK